MHPEKFTILIHGGAGDIKSAPAELQEAYKDRIENILLKLKPHALKGRNAIELVSRAVTLLENDPIFNAGKGSVLNSESEFELDASIMCGKTLNAGSVCRIQNFANPIKIAKKILHDPRFVFLNGSGAEQYAIENGFNPVRKKYFITPLRVQQLKEYKENEINLDIEETPTEGYKLGTVGAVACDRRGNIAAATSTGGICNKKYGRIGDTPIIGASTYADNETLAVSTSGYGEQFIRAGFAKFLSDYNLLTSSNLEESCETSMYYLYQKFQGIGGLVALNSNGDYISRFNTPGLIHGVITQDTIKVNLTNKLTQIN